MISNNLGLKILDIQLLSKGYHLYQDNHYNNVKLSENTYICGTFHLHKGFLGNAIKNKICEREATYCHKGQVLEQVWQDKKEVKLISTLHRVQTEVTEKKNQKGETMKPEKIQDYNKFM